MYFETVWELDNLFAIVTRSIWDLYNEMNERNLYWSSEKKKTKVPKNKSLVELIIRIIN